MARLERDRQKNEVIQLSRTVKNSVCVCLSLCLTTGSVGWKTLKSLWQMQRGRMWSCSPLFAGLIPLRARNTTRGEPIQKDSPPGEEEETDTIFPSVICLVILLLSAIITLDPVSRVEGIAFEQLAVYLTFQSRWC